MADIWEDASVWIRIYNDDLYDNVIVLRWLQQDTNRTKLSETMKYPKPKFEDRQLAKTQKLINKSIRLRDSKDGYGKCFTCGKLGAIKEMDAGHYFSTAKQSVRFHPKNIHLQCKYCNSYLHGNKDIYKIKLIEKYGQKAFDELEWLSHQTKKWTRDELLVVQDNAKISIKIYEGKCE